MDYLYHYCSNQKCFSILNGKTLRLSDIRKSNDYKELSLFYPEILFRIEYFYNENPFPFFYEGKTDKEAIELLIRESCDHWENMFETGAFSNFVVCFSEDGNSLSQWRGYADNGKGCCIGFSFDKIKSYCDDTNGVLRLEKVNYVSKDEVDEIINDYSKMVLDELSGLRSWIVSEMTHDDNDPDTDGLLGFNFDGALESIFIESLKYKMLPFLDEKEWRVFFSNRIYKDVDWLCGSYEELSGPKCFNETTNFLRNKIEFNILDNDIIPYYPLNFSDDLNFIKELWIGPKSIILKSDIDLYMGRNGYKDVSINFSDITYY